MNTKILICKCKHSFQDNKYGKNKRVMNKMNGSTDKYRCTVCLNEKDSK